MKINNIQMIRNFYFMTEVDPDFIRTKPRLMAAVQSNRIDRILNIFTKINK